MGCSCSNLNAIASGSRKIKAEDILPPIADIRRILPDLLRSLPGFHPNHTQLELIPSLLNNPNLLLYIKAYIDNAISTIEFLNNIHQCLDATCKASSSLKDAVKFFNNKDYYQCLSNMKDFAATGNPFAALLVDEYSLIVEQHNAAKDTTFAEMQKLASKLRFVKLSRKVWEGVCKAALVLTLAGALVLSLLGMPPVAATLSSTGSTIISTVEQWLDAILKGREEDLKGKMDVIRSMFTGSLVGDNLETMRAIVERVVIHLDLLENDVKFMVAIEDDEMAVTVAINGISDRLTGLDNEIIRLETMVTSCISEIKDAVTAFFKLILDG